MKQLWDRYNWVVLAAIIVFTAGASSATLGDIGVRLTRLEEAYAGIPASLARIEQKVDDLRGQNGFTGANR